MQRQTGARKRLVHRPCTLESCKGSKALQSLSKEMRICSSPSNTHFYASITLLSRGESKVSRSGPVRRAIAEQELSKASEGGVGDQTHAQTSNCATGTMEVGVLETEAAACPPSGGGGSSVEDEVAATRTMPKVSFDHSHFHVIKSPVVCQSGRVAAMGSNKMLLPRECTRTR